MRSGPALVCRTVPQGEVSPSFTYLPMAGIRSGLLGYRELHRELQFRDWPRTPVKTVRRTCFFSVFSQPKILRTTDLGRTWTDLSGFEGQPEVSTNGFPNVAVYDLLVMPHDEDIIWVGTDIGLFESRDGGQSWLLADNGLPAVSVWQMQVVDDQIVVATFGRGIWTTDLPSAVASAGFGPMLGPDFVFFSDGVHPRIKGYDGSIVMDPDGGGPNRDALRFNSGSGAYRSFGFARNEGVNLTSNLARKDRLHLRLRISPQNRGLEGLSVVFEDKTDGNRRVDATVDLPFRASWRVPEGLRDGSWHEVAIPLPPETWESVGRGASFGPSNGLDCGLALRWC